MTTSPEPISAADREKAKELCAKATRGIWTVIQDGKRWKVISADGDAELGTWTVGDIWWRGNSDFIAFARMAIPSYEARVVELEAEARRLREERDSFQRVGIAAEARAAINVGASNDRK